MNKQKAKSKLKVYCLVMLANFSLTVCSYSQSLITPGEILKFEKTIIIDTAFADKIDIVKDKYRYYFKFVNISEEPIIIERVLSGDPDFACKINNTPVFKNQKDSIGICLAEQQLFVNINRHYTVYFKVGYSSAVYSLNLDLKRIIINNYRNELLVTYNKDITQILDSTGKELIYIQDLKIKKVRFVNNVKTSGNKQFKNLKLRTNDFDVAIKSIKKQMADSVFFIPLNEVTLDSVSIRRLKSISVLSNDTIKINTNQQLNCYQHFMDSIPAAPVFQEGSWAYKTIGWRRHHSLSSSNGPYFVVKVIENDNSVVLHFGSASTSIELTGYGLKQYIIMYNLKKQFRFLKKMDSNNWLNRVNLSNLISEMASYMGS